MEREEGTLLAVLKGMAQYKERFVYPQGWKSATQALAQQLRRDEALKLLTRETEARFDPALQAKLTLDNRKNLALIKAELAARQAQGAGRVLPLKNASGFLAENDGEHPGAPSAPKSTGSALELVRQ